MMSNPKVGMLLGSKESVRLNESQGNTEDQLILFKEAAAGSNLYKLCDLSVSQIRVVFPLYPVALLMFCLLHQNKTEPHNFFITVKREPADRGLPLICMHLLQLEYVGAGVFVVCCVYVAPISTYTFMTQ